MHLNQMFKEKEVIGKLKPRERLMNALLGRPVDRVPTFCSGCAQTVTVECMEAVGVYWPEAHKDPEKMAKLSASVYELVGMEVAGVPYCLTVEAEALGCKIRWGEKKDDVPQVSQTPYTTPTEVKIPDNLLNLKRIPVVLKAVTILKSKVGGTLPIVAGLTGPFALAGHLYGLENLLKGTVLAPDKVHGFVDIAAEVGSMYGKALLEAGADVVLIADPSASCDLISPKTFRTFVKPAITKIVKAIDGVTILHICGNTTPILKDMADTGVATISIDEKVDITEARKIVGDKVRLVGNVSTVRTLLMGTPEKVKEESLKALRAGVDVLAPGCGIPPLTPNANYKALVEAAIEFKKTT
jgi:[methyl-Co(III) methanol-specific corrinoid protein]:coenzyme M methyltransferase